MKGNLVTGRTRMLGVGLCRPPALLFTISFHGPSPMLATSHLPRVSYEDWALIFRHPRPSGDDQPASPWMLVLAMSQCVSILVHEFLLAGGPFSLAVAGRSRMEVNSPPKSPR